jgi:Tol biopolymer transport system component
MQRRTIPAVIALWFAISIWADTNEARFISNVRQVTFEGKSGEGYFSPDGKNIIFQSVREPADPFYQIYMLSLETGDIHRVSSGIGKTTCPFVRPGTDQVLFASTHLDPLAKKKQEDELAFIASGKTRRYSWDYDAEMDIFSARRDGSDIHRLTDAPGYDAEGSYSPDGSKIVFTSLRSAFPLEQLSPEDRKRYETDPAYFGEIYIMNADGSGQTRLTVNPGYDGGPFFTPDGKRILWRRFNTNGLIADAFTMNLDGSGVHQITHFQSMSWAPYAHPSGKYIIFTSNKYGFDNFELFIVDMDGRHEPVRVTYRDDFDGLPVFSPDGKKLCWTSNRKGKPSKLFLANWNDAAALAALDLSGPESKMVNLRSAPSAGQLSSEIRAEDARVHVNFLASDALEGRKTGDPGAHKAAKYIAAELRDFGVAPLSQEKALKDDPAPYFEPFNFTAGVSADKTRTKLSVVSGADEKPSELDKDFRPTPFSSNGEFEGLVVFAGFGLSVPGGAGEGYDSYSGLNVSNKIVLVLRWVPEAVDPKRRAELNRYSGPPYKAMIAREHGARAILIVSGPNSSDAGKLMSLSSEGTISGSEILAASISTEVADKVLAVSNKSLKDLQSALDTENPHAENGFELPGTRVRLGIQLERQTKADQNVVGVIPGSTGEYIMLGAHYDHLGYGDSGDSRQNKNEEHQIHNGADDNASGVATVLELAANFAAEAKETKPKRGLIFALWSGEEMGLLGSSHFAERPPIGLTNIVAYLNFDMVGRLRENKLTLQGTGSSTLWTKEIERRNIPAGFDLTLQADPYLPTDTTSFYPKGIPVLAFFTGSHEDYHRPTDDADKLNYEGIERISKFARAIAQDLINADSRPDYAKVESSAAGGATRDQLRVYLGSIPDYSTEVKGVKLSGVRGGSPAEKGGLQGGDVIIEFAGQKIANIYDYTYALDAAKIGQPLKIKVLRDNKLVELTVTPGARK